MSAVKNFFKGIGNFFKEFGEAVIKGDIFVKGSLLVMGLGHVRRGKYLQGILMTLLELIFAWYCITIAPQYLSKFGTLGTVKMEIYFDFDLFKNVTNDYDNSFLILLYGVISLVIILVFVVLWMNNMRTVYRLQKDAQAGIPATTLRRDLSSILNEKFHITLLAMPVLGVVIFTIVPLIVMIAVAFTNYDGQHMPPSELFTWVGFANFKSLFTDSLTVSFGYSFMKILGWTLVWSILATFTCYFGGIALALLINNKHTRGKKFWRTCFMVAMAVPQFVSLLLVRNFFADNGIVNTICANIGLTDLLKEMGLVAERLTYIPFLTDKNWAKFTILFVNFWVGVPYLLLMATGVLMNIPQDQYEAATIDGANAFQQFKSITMPYMLFVTGPYLVNSVVQNVNNFNVIYLLTNDIYTTLDQKLASSNAQEIDLLVTWLFRLTNSYYNYKMASVIGIMVFIVCSLISLLAFNRMIRGDKEAQMQ